MEHSVWIELISEIILCVSSFLIITQVLTTVTIDGYKDYFGLTQGYNTWASSETRAW